MATFSGNSQTPTDAQKFSQSGSTAYSSPTGNTRSPIAGTGTPSRGVIVNNPEVDACSVDSVQISYKTVKKIALGGAKGDVPVVFDFPVTKVWIASKDSSHTADAVFLHLSKLGKQYTGNAIIPDGTEAWFDMTYYGVSGLTFLGKVVEFRKPITRCYLDLGQEAGGGDYFVTVGGSNDVAMMAADQIGTTAS